MVSPQVLETTPHELVVLKPAGLASELPRDARADSLVQRLAALGFGDLRLVHRLDAPACGLMVVARSPESAAYYAAEIEARRWHKRYVARVAVPAATAAALVGAHKAFLKTIGRRAEVVRAGGRPSFLDVVSAAPAPDARQADVLIRLHTGRFHQIRAMLAHLGAPLVGDTRYGGPAGPMYLEHVMLAARPYGAGRWRVWLAPPHADRPRWHASLAEAVQREADTLATDVEAMRT